jgi:hypothetical protein
MRALTLKLFSLRPSRHHIRPSLSHIISVSNLGRPAFLTLEHSARIAAGRHLMLHSPLSAPHAHVVLVGAILLNLQASSFCQEPSASLRVPRSQTHIFRLIGAAHSAARLQREYGRRSRDNNYETRFAFKSGAIHRRSEAGAAAHCSQETSMARW